MLDAIIFSVALIIVIGIPLAGIWWSHTIEICASQRKEILEAIYNNNVEAIYFPEHRTRIDYDCVPFSQHRNALFFFGNPYFLYDVETRAAITRYKYQQTRGTTTS